jgi:hypothetical protein
MAKCLIVFVVLLLSLGARAESVGRKPTIYYFAAGGTDAGTDCKSRTAPCQSINRLNALSYKHGDQILLRGGDGFTGCIRVSASNAVSSPDYPITIGMYGAGTPTLTANCPGNAAAAVNINGVNAIVQDLTIRPGANSPQAGIWFHNDNGASPITVTAQRVDCGGFHFAPTNAGACGYVTGYPGPKDGAFSAVNILNNTFCGLTGATSPDDAGISGFGYGENIKNIVYQGNVICNIGGYVSQHLTNGISVNGVSNGTVDFNLIHDIGANVTTCGGPTGVITVTSKSVTLQFMEIYNVQPAVGAQGGCDWDGADIDVGSSFSLIQDTYTHDNFGAGYLLYAGTQSGFNWLSNTLRDSISENDARDAAYGISGFGGISLTMFQNAQSWVYNNTVFNNTIPYSVLAYVTGVKDGGTGGTPGLTTFNVGGTCITPPTVQGTINSNGVLTGAIKIISRGQCSVVSLTPTITGGGLTAGRLDGLWNGGCSPGFTIFSNVSFSSMIANNIFNNGKCADSAYGPGPFQPIHNANNGVSASTVQFINNDMITSNSGTLNIFINNTPYKSIESFEAAGWGSANLGIPPEFSAAPPRGTCPSWKPSSTTAWPPTGCATPYLLSKTSTLIGGGAALNVAGWTGGIPTRDYYGNATFSNGVRSGWNVGADGGSR